MKIKDFLIKNKEVLQLVYGISLMVLIPLIVVLNTVYIINKYNSTLDVTLQRQALSFGRTIYSLVRNDLDDIGSLQEKVDLVTKQNKDIQELNILKPVGDRFKVINSSNAEKVGEELQFYYYDIAWSQPDNDGLATDSLSLSSSPDYENTAIRDAEGERFWLVALPISNLEGEKQALLTVKVSSKIIDDLTDYNRRKSTYFLVITALIVILFLMINIRLWDYALLYKKIKEVDEMKNEFISMASHELRSPVTSIKGYVSMILEGSYGAVSEEAKQGLKNVETSTERLIVLVEDMLNVGRIEQGKISMKSEPTDATPLITKTIENMSIQAKEKKLNLSYKPHKDQLPLINIDSDRFIQVLVNLISNAVKYTEKGEVEILTSERNRGSILEFKVKDTGIGMSADDRKKLFQKFYRIRNEKTREVSGTGLGLWITQQIVNLMGGNISVDSIENVGTQISFSFPVVPKEELK